MAAAPASTVAAAPAARHHKWYQHLYAQVLAAILAGVLLGHFYPELGAQMKPFGATLLHGSAVRTH